MALGNYQCFETAHVHAICSVLKRYLAELPEPLIPFHMYQRVINVTRLPVRLYWYMCMCLCVQ